MVFSVSILEWKRRLIMVSGRFMVVFGYAANISTGDAISDLLDITMRFNGGLVTPSFFFCLSIHNFAFY